MCILHEMDISIDMKLKKVTVVLQTVAAAVALDECSDRKNR